MEFNIDGNRKWVAAIILIVLVIGGFLLFSEKEDPSKLAIGKWMETRQGVTAEITPERALVESKSERRKYSCSYTIDTWESPYEVSFFRGGNLVGTAIVEFDGKDKVLVKKKPVHGEGDIEKAINDYASVWTRVKE